MRGFLILVSDTFGIRHHAYVLVLGCFSWDTTWPTEPGSLSIAGLSLLGLRSIIRNLKSSKVIKLDITKISIGKNPPHEVNALIEIPQGGHPVKYEMDKVSGAMYVDRFLHSSMIYPGNYGFIPHTLSEDGDPCDILVVGQYPVISGAIIRSRPVGALLMEDESGMDEKILAVPVDQLHPFYSKVNSYTDLPEILCQQIGHFFQHYKDLEKGKWVSIVKWIGPEEAHQVILDAMARNRTGLH
jgi:inorganic pyrophosphatase